MAAKESKTSFARILAAASLSEFSPPEESPVDYSIDSILSCLSLDHRILIASERKTQGVPLRSARLHRL